MGTGSDDSGLETWSPDRQTLPVTAGETALPDRYEDRGLLGLGGMGEVRRVWDRELNRSVAMKVLKPGLSVRSEAVARFVEEAQTSAQLQHPGVLPVYELGWLPDGRRYFTMQEIRGRTLGDAIAEVHEASTESGWGTGASGVGFRRLIEAMRTVCVAVGYAHRRGVVHRDLKPANILLGDDGEVLVVDWGIARLQHTADETTDPVVTGRGLKARDSVATSLTGTPAYMPPEQARGDAVGSWTDVWALGAVLYEVFCGCPPHHELRDVHALIVARMMGRPPTPIRELARHPVPDELRIAAERALSTDPTLRQPDGAALASELGLWLDGEARREQALGLVHEARVRREQAAALRSQAGQHRTRASALLADVPAWAPEAEKLEAWDELERAQGLAREAELSELDAEQRLHASLTYAPDLQAARRELATHYRRLHVEAERARDPEGARRAEAFLRSQLDALPEGAVQRDHQRYLEGTGALTLVTDPPGAEVILHRFEPHRRRLVARADRVLGPTPLVSEPLPPGSWLATIRHPDCEDVQYPIHIDRLGHWDGVPPEGGDPVPICLPPTGALREGERYVPPGWFIVGGDPDAPGSPPVERFWADGYVIHRDPVTNREWLAFADSIAAAEGMDAAWQVVPTDFSGIERDQGLPIYRLDAAGRFELGPDPDGDVWDLDWPTVMITITQVARFLQWRSACDGVVWRLPASLEWEKAARGVDGRTYPWGDGFDPSWCVMREHRPIGLGRVGDNPVDTSVYGVRGTAGNAADWCLEQADHVLTGPRVVVPDQIQDGNRQVGRGGSWNSTENLCRSAARGFCYPHRPLYSQGVRLCRTDLGWVGRGSR